jgi:hypothetical protein
MGRCRSQQCAIRLFGLRTLTGVYEIMLRLKYSVAAIVGLTLLWAAPQLALATTVTLLNTWNSHAGGAWAVTNTGGIGQSVAVPFTTPITVGHVTITDVDAYIGLPPLNATGSATIGIMADNAGVPSGTFLFDSIVTLQAGLPPCEGPPCLVDLDSLHWKLDPDTKYWLAAIASDGTSAGWGFSSVQTIGLAANTYIDGPVDSGWASHGLDLPLAVISARIPGPPDPPEVPLPAALPLFATSLVGLGLLGWRRKRKTAEE